MIIEEQLQSIAKILSSYQFALSSEMLCKDQMEWALKFHGFDFKREYSLDKKNRPDFFIAGVAVEVKIKESATKIFRQCERYAKFDEVKALLLVTNTSMGFPATINGKPSFMVQLGKGWL